MRLKLLFLLFFVYSFTWSQITFSSPTTTAGTFKVPARGTLLSEECWGIGSGGGGVTTGLFLFADGGRGFYSKVATYILT